MGNGSTVSSSHMLVTPSSSGGGLLSLPLQQVCPTGDNPPQTSPQASILQALPTLTWVLCEVTSPDSKPAPAQTFQGLTASFRRAPAPAGLLQGLHTGPCSTVSSTSCRGTAASAWSVPGAAGEPQLLQQLLPLAPH